MWSFNLFFPDSTPYHNTWAVHKLLMTFRWTFSTPNPHILLLTELFRRKMHSSEKTILEVYSEYTSGWFWQCRENWSRLILSLFWRPRKFCSLYGYMNKHLRKMRCMVAVEMSRAVAASLILSWGWSWNIDRTCSTIFSLVRDLPYICAFHESRVPLYDIVRRRGFLSHLRTYTGLCSRNRLISNIFGYNMCFFLEE